jgi:hypothetical protein
MLRQYTTPHASTAAQDKPRNRLDPERVIDTIEQLSRRIEERFPDTALIDACNELLYLSQEAKRRASRAARPIIWLRAVSAVTIIGMAGVLIGTVTSLEPSSRPLDVVIFVNFLEAGINNVVLLAIAAFFLLSLETRIKRVRSLVAIHELRSLAHVIDMHQLTKDPDRLLFRGGDTESSPVTNLGIFEMSRYLDYCCEMLSLVGKIAAIYGVQWRDEVSLQAVNDVDRLTTGMSQKIFQKVMILHGSAGNVLRDNDGLRTRP